MSTKQNQSVRTLSIAFTTRGFGFAVMEEKHSLVAYGKKALQGNKNSRSLRAIGKLITKYQPNSLVLYNVNAKGARRHPRIKKLHERVMELAKQQELKVVTVSGAKIRSFVVGHTGGTKHEIAKVLAERYPDELAWRLPPKRTASRSADSRMDIFDAVALGISFDVKTENSAQYI